MAIADLREWIEKVEKLGDLLRVEGADWDLEIGAITDLYQRKMGLPALLFDKIKDYPPGYRVLANSCTSLKRIALSMEMSPLSGEMELIQLWRDYLTNFKLVPPKVVKKGVVQENILSGKKVNLLKFPTPKWHELDGGRFMGTGCLVIMKDLETNWVNLGAYRVQVFDENTASVMISKGKHGHIILQKYLEKKKPCPVAISVGQDPLLFMIAGMEIPYGINEYEVCGAFKKEAVEVIIGEVSGLPLPARAEIVIEGEISPTEKIEEGPFGEWTGYYASGVRPQPVIKVKSILHRNDPIILGAMPRRPPNDDTYYRGFIRCALVWDELEKAGVPGIKKIWAPEAGGGRFMLVVSIKQMYPGHSKQAGLIASQCHSGAYANRLVVVVDDDIDPTDLDDVLWAICTRTEAREDVEILKRCWSTALDPMSYPLEERIFNSRLVIDSCKPWERLKDFPPTVGVSDGLKEKIIKKWRRKLPHLED